MEGAQIGVLEHRHEVRFRCFLQRQDGRALKAEVVLADEALEWQFLDEQVAGPLVFANFAQRCRAGAVAMGFLDSTRSGPASCLGGELFAGGLATSWLAGGLFGARHVSVGG